MNYKQFDQLPKDYISEKLELFLAEDMPEGDITSSPIFSDDTVYTAELQAQEDLILAGRDIISVLFDNIGEVEIFFSDGQKIKNDEIIAKIKAPAIEILQRERVMLNLLQRMCGIATFSAKLAEIARPYGVKILDTRKTTPGLRLFEKYAVRCGGCHNHRFDLSSGVLIKDNHIEAAGSITEAISKIRKKTDKLIEVEVENFEQIEEALHAQTNGFLLDNMSPETVKKAVAMIRQAPDGKDIFIEASGGINENNLAEYVKTGVDAISIGALTHSVKSADMHLEII